MDHDDNVQAGVVAMATRSAREPARGRWSFVWDIVQYGSPIVFGVVLFFVGFYGLGWMNHLSFVGDYLTPTTPEGAARMMSWVVFAPYVYLAIQLFTVAMMPGGHYIGRTIDTALSGIPALAIVLVVGLYYLGNTGVTWGLYEWQFLWHSGFAVVLDITACSMIGQRIALRTIDSSSGR